MRKFGNHFEYLEIHDQVVNCVDWVQDKIYSGCLSGDLVELTKDPRSQKYYTSRTSLAHNLAVTDIASSLDGEKIVTSSLDGNCFVTDRETMKPIRTIDCPNAFSPHCAINQRGTVVSVVGKGGSLYIDNFDETFETTFENANDAFFKAVQFYGENETEVIGLARHTLSQVDVETRTTVYSLFGSTAKKAGKLKRSLNCLATNPNQKLVAAGTVSGYIQFFDFTAPDENITEIKVGGQLVEKIKFSNDGKTLAIASSNKRVYLLDMTMLQHPYIEQQRSRIISIAFDHDSKQIVSASEDKTVIIAKIVEDEF
ncbi:hypothetical protein TRFO_25253 [Tritrichomonas foetus]|uniref:Anaphase-promoting complex subunit 4 WD40 domain-containing protein n=1 Tax=Tritrichomonas foetus TaxID=1144522 RepID=A0A1J4KAC3_9EUKA|nr:hypothetical protein TRFO_25253 [Tritrichomonas foetus]|eukprot:OHT06644.1 hypothetical protein TRFO_25253 [Tritrichomonas foetus]